ncbi:MAG: ABC transporter permease [Micrococcales bacterium]|nr:ABC transporter permease [Micrococcales bacterium]
MKAFLALTRAQWKGFWRERQNLFWILAFPLMFLVLFGSIYRDDVAPKYELVQVGDVALFDRMPAEGRQALADVFEITKTTDKAAAIQKVKDGDADGAVSMTGNTLEVSYSGADATAAGMLQGTLDSFVQSANQAVSKTPATFRLKSTRVEDSRLKPIQFLAPGLLGWAVAMGATFNSAMPFVQWRVNKLLRRIRLTPVRPESLVGSRALLSIVIALIQTALFIGIGVAFFGLKLSGAAWAAIPLVMAATLAFMALGLIVGAISKTVDAASGIANVVTLPMAFLSGSFIPLEMAPDWLLAISKFMPLRWLNDGLMDVLVRGKGAEAIGLPILVLLAFAIVCSLIAARLFKWDDKAA